MRIKGFIMAAALGMGIMFSTGTQAMAAQWTCPYEHENCPGQEYCEQHKDCVANGSCSHQDNHNSNSGRHHSGSGHCRRS